MMNVAKIKLLKRLTEVIVDRSNRVGIGVASVENKMREIKY